ncbi:MAG: nucleoside hydrolase [Anaerolineae bacterium]|nr:nucleoside hydrolase [Anaerolineae bacterium]
MTTRIILDTDIGTDVDDCLALALILKSPELRLEGITCVYGDVLLRSRMVMKLLELYGTQVPVMAGARKPLMGLRPVYWEGHEGEGVLEAGDERLMPEPEFAADYIVRMVMENPGSIHLVGIGPLTNIALALLKEPRVAEQVAQITLMGGVVRGLGRLDLPYSEHNILCDADAAHVVFSSGAPINVIPLDLTTRVKVNRDGVERIRQGGTAFHAAVVGQLERYPRFEKQGWTNLHDPLAVASVIDPSLVRMEAVRIDVETGGRHTLGATVMRAQADSRSRVAVDVDVERFEAFFIERVER